MPVVAVFQLHPLRRFFLAQFVCLSIEKDLKREKTVIYECEKDGELFFE